MPAQTSVHRPPRWSWLLACAFVAPLVAQQRISIKSGTRAVRDSVRATARAFLSPEPVKRPAN